MVTTLGLLIIVGFLLVMGARWLSQRQQQQIDGEALRQSTDQLKEELERSADAVINRMGSHIKHLERLLQEADDRSRRLEAQLEEAKKAGLDLEQQLRQLSADTLAAHRASEELASRWQAQASLMPPVLAPMVGAAAPSPVAAREPERVDAQDFAQVLQQSMERDELTQAQNVETPPVSVQQAAGLAEAMNSRAAQSAVAEPVAESEEAAPADDGVDISPNAAKARALLLSGYSVEETARETGIGKGAIELLREMNRRELEKE
ncbi:hypothetical protein [Selenomonas sp. GACV-9]|uniref:hypothetical protein n=1 Tax=Selenomonas sp. GACV-9 TaxID=3158782 RepID=UPI00094D69D7